MNQSRSVPIYKLEFDDSFVKQYKDGCERILKSDSLAEGKFVSDFENKFSEFIGAKHCVAVSSGTAALEVAMRALDVKGKSVIMPTNTFIATAIAAIRAGAEVVLLDIEEDTFALYPDALKKAITKNTGAVILVHIGGIISKYAKEIVNICEKNGVPLIEDAAHAHGATRGDLKAGTIGRIGCFSFFPTKVMTTGEGGMITTNDGHLANLMRSIKNFGRDLTNPIFSIRDGLNYKVTEFQALLGLLEMGRVQQRIAKRTILAHEYQKLLSGTSYRAIGYEDGKNSYYKQIVKINFSQDALHKFCKKHNVSLTGEVYRYPVHQQPVFKGIFDNDNFPVANRFSKQHICPPLYPELEIEDVRYVCEVLKLAEKELLRK